MSGDDSLLYRRFAKPELGRLFSALKLDIDYVRGEGDVLTWRDAAGHEHDVLDFLGGYGASLFGHNHPRLVEALRSALSESRVFNAQKSCRARAAQLARRLSELIGETSAQSYVTTLTNSGAEAAEAALKHAALAYGERCERQRRGLICAAAKAVARFRRGEIRAAPGLAQEARRSLPGLGQTSDVAQIVEAAARATAQALARTPLFVALDGAFHGLTTGAVQLTAGARYRSPFAGLGVETLRLESASGEALRKIIEDASVDLFEVCVLDAELHVVRRPWSRIGALFVEPMQGEGGIHAMTSAFLQALRELADAMGFALVFDEIQSGMGRTGSFLFCEQLGVWPDYVLLGKSLGGGLTKVAALLVDRRLYCDEFSLAHSSTFAEDDLSATVALASLDVLASDQLCRLCAESGAFAKEQLAALAQRHPGVIEEVRGEGLMLGVALRDFRRSSSLPLQMLAEQEMLGYVISGYLLHTHGIRVGPTLSQAGTIRIEPSAYVSRAQVSALLGALDELCQRLERGDVAGLVRYLLPDPAQQVPEREHVEVLEPERKLTLSERLPREDRALDELPQVAFLAHFATADDIVDWEPSFGTLSKTQREALLDRVHDVLDPMVHDRTIVRSRKGSAICMNVIGLCIDARLMSQYVRGRDRRIVLRQIETAVALAEQLGCRIIGLGGYTSIVAGNGMLLKSESAALTTGNSLTVGMGLASIRRAAAAQGSPLCGARFAAVGAGGNIASTYAEMISREVASVHLIGRGESLARLRETAGRILRGAAEAALAYVREEAERPSGVEAALLDRSCLALLRSRVLAASDTQLFNALAAELGGRCPVTIGSDFTALTQADVILSASNSPHHVILPEMIGAQPTIICDISVPPDADPRIEELRPNAALIRGGIVKMPNNPDFHPPGSPLPPGRCYACLAETALLGLQGVRENFSYGPISPEQVRVAMQFADAHGFVLAETDLHKRGYNMFSGNLIEQVA